MGKDKLRLGFLALIVITTVTLVAWFINSHSVALLNTQGIVGDKEKQLIITALLLMMIVVIPVYILTFVIAFRYRAGNKKAKYSPGFDGSRKLELTWWAIPGVIILILSIITWRSSHELDPFRPLDSNKQPLNIQVVALQWKWLFIYPDQKIASVNLAAFPVGRPVNLNITSDAPMNSFWIPQLAGQIYAMSGMNTQLHIRADKAGDYRGVSANISGKGFADMHFTARAESDGQFADWINVVRSQNRALDTSEYTLLAKPKADTSTSYYSDVEAGLYNKVLEKYSSPTGEQTQNLGGQ